jgi:hypothetical protein
VTLLEYSNEYRKQKYCMFKSINCFMSYRAWITILEKANAGVNILVGVDTSSVEVGFDYAVVILLILCYRMPFAVY